MELKDVLVQAMKLETDGQMFYETLAAAMTDPEAAAMFKQLAADEVTHYNYIERQYEALEAGKGWAAIPEMATVKVIEATSVVFPPEKQVLTELPPHPTEADALLFALGIEDKSFKLYYNSAQIATDPEAQQLFRQLASAEQTHFNVLMGRYESRYGYPR